MFLHFKTILSISGTCLTLIESNKLHELFDYIYCRKKLYSIPGYELEIQFFVSEQIL